MFRNKKTILSIGADSELALKLLDKFKIKENIKYTKHTKVARKELIPLMHNLNFNEEINKYISEAKKILKIKDLNITFVIDNNLIIPGNGVGGNLIEPTLISIGYDENFKNKEILFRNLRAAIFHEVFHAAQGWSDNNSKIIPKDLIEDAILEGAATVFEREFGGTIPAWGLYENNDTMLNWLNEIKQLNVEGNLIDYKFGEVNGNKWMLYKLGTWIVDNVLDNNKNLNIVDLARIKPNVIFSLANIQ
ncbi:MAG: DUF2268 domain-containing putative Zn-dependent protease [bacterium]